MEHCRADVFAMLKKDEAIKGCAACCRRQEASAWICLMASRMARRTCKLLVRAFDWGAPLLRKLRASEASFFFCHVQAAPCARLTMEPFFTFSFLFLRAPVSFEGGRIQLFTRTGIHIHIILYNILYIYICIESWDVPSFKGCTAYTAVLFLAVARWPRRTRRWRRGTTAGR